MDEELREYLNKIKEKAFLLQEKCEEYSIPIANQAKIVLDISETLKGLINERNWSIRAYIGEYSIVQNVSVTHGLIIFLRCSDFSGNEISWPLTEYAGYYRSPCILDVAGVGSKRILEFCDEFLWSVNSRLDAAYEEALSSLPAEIQSIYRRFSATLHQHNTATRNHNRWRDDEVKKYHEKERNLYKEIGGLKRKLEEAERRASDEFQKLLDLRGMLYGIQRIIEEEARNLYNTRTFLSGSKTIQSIRERLMSAISEVALGTWSIYHDHKPPADLMPVSGVLPPDIKRLKELGVRTPGENSTKQ